MALRRARRWSIYLSMLGITSLLATGCSALRTFFLPEDPPALTALYEANDAILASKQAGVGERYPDDLAELEKRYQLARGTFYACQESKALSMAQNLLAHTDALNTRLAKTPEPGLPPPPANRAPTAPLQAPTEGDINALVPFRATGSTDEDGDALTYHWDFGDGKTATFRFPAATRRYTKIGNYTVRLTVDDGHGNGNGAGDKPPDDPQHCPLWLQENRLTTRSRSTFGAVLAPPG